MAFRTGTGSKLSAAEGQSHVVFEADNYDSGRRAGWSVVVKGYTQAVYEDAEIEALDRLVLDSWADEGDRPFWIRIRPESVSGRVIAAHESAGVGEIPLPRTSAPEHDATVLQVLNVLRGEASHVRSTPFGGRGHGVRGPRHGAGMCQ